MYASSFEQVTPKVPQTKSRRFTPEEDALIKDLVENKKISPWSAVAQFLPGRTGPQCRDRYNSYLFENTSSKRWTPEEDKIIVEKYREFGPRWVMISQFLPGRNGNSIKNRWHKSLVKYHGISHKEVKQERRNKNLKYCIKKSQPENSFELMNDVEAEIDELANTLVENVLSSFESESEASDMFNDCFEFNTFI